MNLSWHELHLPDAGKTITVEGVSPGLDGLLLYDLSGRHKGHLVHISVNDAAMVEMENSLLALGVPAEDILKVSCMGLPAL